MTIWTDERIKKLRNLHHDGLSARDISIQLGPHVTRNAVSGKLYRLGLQTRGSRAVSLYRKGVIDRKMIIPEDLLLPSEVDDALDEIAKS